MHDKRTKEEWNDVLNSKIWDLEEFEQEVFQPLLLSYYDLAPAIKCCLLFCAIFPKGYVFDKDYLITLWMAQDYLNSNENKDKGIIGNTFFDNLAARSFFQDFKKDRDSGKIISCKMHDIVHDFVQFLTQNECLITEAKGGKNEVEVSGDKVRHLTLTFVPYGQRPLSISSYSRKNIRTLRASRLRISTVDSGFISQLKGLRTLNLSGNSIKELPEEIGDLIHLRHIDLCANVGLEVLPDSICDLYNLYTLRLKRCYALRKLPDNMGKLINLKHLYVEGCAALVYLPKGLGRLTGLQTLDECVVFCGDNEKAFQFADLRTLNLEGRLTITFPGDVEDAREVEKAQLWDKKQLFHLGLISRVEDNMQRKSSAVDILRPHEDLESLYVFGHIGTSWPNWMASLHSLRILTLSAWDECELLPPLGKLPSLERLTLRWMERVKKVGVEFLGVQDQTSFKSSSSLFPKLKELSFYEMSEWEEWEGVEGWKKEDCELTVIMPCLSSLGIHACPKLKALPDFVFKRPLQNLELL